MNTTRTHLMMAAHYRALDQRAAAARSLLNAQACLRVARALPIAEYIVSAKRYDGSINAFAARYLP